MRLCVLGGHGKTGLKVVETARLLAHEVRVLEGDALDAEALTRAISGSEAVISLLGPVRGSVDDFCSRATTAVIDVMRSAGVRRLVMVTGAMCGPPQELGLFYRSMIKIPSLGRAVADRRRQEELVMASGLQWTLVRPPRLTDDEPASRPVFTVHGPVRMMESCARTHLAQALVKLAVTGEQIGHGVYVHTPGALVAA